MNILITGASGFIGGAVAKELLKYTNITVIAGIRSSSIVDETLLKHKNIILWPLWGSSIEWPNRVHCDVVIHCAAIAELIDENINGYKRCWLVNTLATIELAKLAAQNGVKRFIFVSSAKVSGALNAYERSHTEETDPVPADLYSLTKFEAEQGLLALQSECNDMELVIIRPPLVYGIGVKGSFKLLINWVKRGVPLPFAAINNQRSFVSLTNLVDFIVLCSDISRSPRAAGQTFFVSDDEFLSTSELIKRIANSYKKTIILFWAPKILLYMALKILGRSSQLNNLYYSAPLNISKAKKILRWVPKNTMLQELDEMSR